jgi:hypothetical protein
MATMHTRRSPRLVPFALTADDEAAHRWLDALHDAGIPAELHIEDGTRLATGSSVFPTGRIFATAIYIAPQYRDRAAALLIDLGWDGKQRGAGQRRRSRDQLLIVAGAVGMSLLGLVLAIVLRGL